MIASSPVIEGIYTLCQTVLNVVFAVCIVKARRRLDDVEARGAFENVALLHRIAALEAAERARKELTK